jgi:hypothetical protein
MNNDIPESMRSFSSQTSTEDVIDFSKFEIPSKHNFFNFIEIMFEIYPKFSKREYLR